jgi:hypothetical protein
LMLCVPYSEKFLDVPFKRRFRGGKIGAPPKTRARVECAAASGKN